MGLDFEGPRFSRFVPPIRDDAGSRFHGFLHERGEASGGSVRNPAQPDAPDALPVDLGGDARQGLVAGVPAPPTSTFFEVDTLDVRLVDLDVPREAIPTGTHHGASQFLKTGPGRFVAPHPEQTLESEGTDPVFGIRDPPDRREPGAKGKVAAVEDGACGFRRLVFASDALQETPLHRPVPVGRAPWAAEAFEPAPFDEVAPAVLLGRQPAFELGQGARVVLHGGRTPPLGAS